MLTLLHTAAVHVATFDALRDRIAPGTRLRHIVREEWLEEARDRGITPDLEARMAEVITGPVVCTCTTLGPAAARLGALRIDQPMMRAAAQTRGPVVMAYALESTRAASRALFLAEGGEAGQLRLLDLTDLWPLFESGDVPGFHAAIAEAAVDRPAGETVVLAQASMAGAAPMIAAAGHHVLASPEMALRAGLALLD